MHRDPRIRQPPPPPNNISPYALGAFMSEGNAFHIYIWEIPEPSGLRVVFSICSHRFKSWRCHLIDAWVSYPLASHLPRPTKPFILCIRQNEVAAWCSYFVWRYTVTCMSVIQFKVCSGRMGVSLGLKRQNKYCYYFAGWPPNKTCRASDSILRDRIRSVKHII